MQLSFCLFASLTFSDVVPRNVPAVQTRVSVHPQLERKRAFLVKFAEDRTVRLDRGRLHEQSNHRLDCLDLLEGCELERVFSRSVEDLDQERQRCMECVPPGWPLPADLNNYYRVHTSNASETLRLVNAMNSLEEVEIAYLEPSRESLVLLGEDLAPTTPLLESGQGYLDSAPIGLGYREVAGIVGSGAPDLRIGQLEFGWYFDHEDACELIRANVIGNQPTSLYDTFAPHGNAVAGVLMANRNRYGILGMTHQAGMIIGSVLANASASDTISMTAAVAQPGDVFVASYAFLLTTGGQAPMDFFQADFDAIYTATLSGITYVFGAGNASQDLGDESLFGTRYLPDQPDSGGVIVGGGQSTDLAPWPQTSYGERVDCHAWAENITTLNFANELFSQTGEKQNYTAVFGGTSGAGPMVAGVAAVLSNVVREQENRQLTPFEIRDLLRTVGTPQDPGVDIGPRPDLVQLLATFGLPDGLIVNTSGLPGDPLDVEIRGDPSQRFLLYLSNARARIPTNKNRDLLIAFPVQGVVLASFDEFGVAAFNSTVPDDPLLAGSTFYLQALDVQANGDLHLSNSAEIAFR